ncbi:MAG: VOC family protein, partial [Woeseiaceae bacterium]
LNFENRPLPSPPQISVQQGGKEQCAIVAPGVNAVVRWSDFTEGRADPNDILDDLIFVILTDADGNRVAHSGRPFEDRPYLDFASENFVIDGDLLLPEQTYTLSVEHALLDDTTRLDTVPAFTTRAVTTKFTLHAGPSDQESCIPMTNIPSLTSQVTMFYYKDIEPAAYFYGELLGLEKTFDLTWVKFYKTGPASTVGLVTEGDGGWHKVQDTNAVMLSLVTEEVDAWYERLRDKEDLTILKEIGDGGPVRSFLLEDPGGYTVEFFEWLEAQE